MCHKSDYKVISHSVTDKSGSVNLLEYKISHGKDCKMSSFTPKRWNSSERGYTRPPNRAAALFGYAIIEKQTHFMDVL